MKTKRSYWLAIFFLLIIDNRIIAQQPRLVVPLVHSDVVLSATFSADGKKFLTCSRDKTAKLWDVSSGKLLANFEGHTNTVYAAALSADGKRVITASEDKTAKIWDAASGKMIGSIDLDPGSTPGYIPVFSPDGKQILDITRDANENKPAVKLYDAANGKGLFGLKDLPDQIDTAFFSNDGKKITCFSGAAIPKTWDALSGKLLDSLKGYDVKTYSRLHSPDGRKLATFSNENKPAILDMATGKLINKLEGQVNNFLSATFSPDSKKLVIFSKDSKPTIWDVSSGKLIDSLEEKTDNVSLAIFSPDGQKLMTNSNGPVISTWNVSSGKLMSVTEQPGTGYEQSIKIDFAVFSPDGKKLMTINSLRGIDVLDASTGKSLGIFQDTEIYGGIYSAAFSPDGKKILVANNELDFLLYTATILDASSGKILASLAAHTYMAEFVVFSPDGKELITTHDRPDFNAKAWDVLSGKLLYRLGHGDIWGAYGARIYSVQFSPDGKKIITSATDNTTKLWDASTGILIADIEKDPNYKNDGSFQHHISAIAFSPDGKKITCTKTDGSAKVYDASTGKPIVSLDGNLKYDYNYIRFSADGQKVITGYAKLDKLKIWDANSGKYIAEITENIYGFSDPVFSADNKIAAFYAGRRAEHRINIWDARSGKLVTVAKEKPGSGQPGIMSSLVFSPDGKKIATTASDSTCTIWNADTGTPLIKLNKFENAVSKTAFSNDGKKIVTILGNKEVNIWDAVTGKFIAGIKDRSTQAIVAHASFSPDDKRILTTDPDKMIRIWDAANGKSIANLEWDRSYINTVEFSPDGKKIATALSDHTVKIWDASTGQYMYTFFALDSFDYINLVAGGYYQSSTGAAKLLHYVTGDSKIISFEQLDVKYNRPDRVLEAMGNTDTVLIRSYHNAYIKRIEKLRIDTTAFRDDYTVPEADFVNRDTIVTEQKNEKMTVHIRGVDNAYSLDRFNIWVNEVPLFGIRGSLIRDRHKNAFDTTINIALSYGINRIETSVTNVNGIESYRKPLIVNYGPADKQEDKIYFIGVGINHFADSTHDLKWCVQDIKDLTKTMKEKYGDRLVIVDTLYNEKATRTNIRSLKKKLMNTTVNDKVIFSYSGHGMLSKDYDYYISSYTINFSNPEEGGIPYDEIENMLDSIPARKKILLLDACHSGEVDKEEMKKIQNASSGLSQNHTTINNSSRGVIVTSTDSTARVGLQNSFDLMQSLFVNVGKGTGAIIISASGGVQFAQERSELGHGVFTYSVIEAMKKYPSIKVSALRKYINDRVMDLTNGLQKPTTRSEPVAVDWEL